MGQTVDFQPTDWGKYAICYDTLLKLKPYQDLLKQSCSKLDVQPSDKVLDLGCGTGNLLRKIALQHQRLIPSGIDFSPDMLEIANKKCGDDSVSLVQADINMGLPYNDESFSKIVCVNALYTFTDPKASLLETFRILEHGGKVVFATPKQGFENGLILKAHAKDEKADSFWSNSHKSPEREELLIRAAISDEALVEQMLYIAHHNRLIARTSTFHFFTAESLKRLFSESGFTVLDISPAYANQAIMIHAQKEAA